MKANFYVNQMRETLMNQKTIRPKGRKTDWDIFLHYAAAEGYKMEEFCASMDFPLIKSMSFVFPSIPDDEIKLIAKEGYLDSTDVNRLLNEFELSNEYKLSKKEQYGLAVSLYLDELLSRRILKESRAINRYEGLETRENLRTFYKPSHRVKELYSN